MHTPGPWWIDDDGFVASGNGDTYTTIADPHCGNQDIDEREANARLIAKAPAMHDVLSRVAAFWAGGDVPEDLDRDIRALLED